MFWVVLVRNYRLNFLSFFPFFPFFLKFFLKIELKFSIVIMDENLEGFNFHNKQLIVWVSNEMTLDSMAGSNFLTKFFFIYIHSCTSIEHAHPSNAHTMFPPNHWPSHLHVWTFHTLHLYCCCVLLLLFLILTQGHCKFFVN